MDKEQKLMDRSGAQRTVEGIHDIIYPQIDDQEEDTGDQIDFFLWVALTRRLVVRGFTIDELQELVQDHGLHQLNHRKARTH